MNLHHKLLLKTIGYVALYELITVIISAYIGYYWNDWVGRSLIGVGFIVIPIVVSYLIFWKKIQEYQEAEFQNWLLKHNKEKMI